MGDTIGNSFSGSQDLLGPTTTGILNPNWAHTYLGSVTLQNTPFHPDQKFSADRSISIMRTASQIFA